MTREEAINQITLEKDYIDSIPGSIKAVEAFEMAIEALKQPEQKKGYWIRRPIAGYATVRCSVCTELFWKNQGRWNFCPHCGAEMEGEE